VSDQLTPPTDPQWRDLKDGRGKLYARIDGDNFLLEVRRNHESVIFDLRDYLDISKGLDRRDDLE